MKKRAPRKSPSSAPSLRIIGGQWRGRKLGFAEVDGLRPTGDRIRETLFNWLQPHLPGARCLDLFSGSGALGFEALSRGAANAILLEKHPNAAQTIQENLKLLGGEQHGRVLNADALDYLSQEAQSQYDIVFMDPPFAADLWQSAIDTLEQHHWLSDDAAIYIETSRSHPLTVPENWHLHRQKDSGEVSYYLFYRTPK